MHGTEPPATSGDRNLAVDTIFASACLGSTALRASLSVLSRIAWACPGDVLGQAPVVDADAVMVAQASAPVDESGPVIGDEDLPWSRGSRRLRWRGVPVGSR